MTEFCTTKLNKHMTSYGGFVWTDLVKMHDGSYKMIESVEKGDVVLGGFTVIVKVEFFLTSGVADLVQIQGGPSLTPWQPIFLENKQKWEFPANLGKTWSTPCNQVYNFLLDKGHILCVNGHDCVTLGHNYTHDPVLIHPYFGTNKVVEDLEKQNGYKEGTVVLVDVPH